MNSISLSVPLKSNSHKYSRIAMKLIYDTDTYNSKFGIKMKYVAFIIPLQGH